MKKHATFRSKRLLIWLLVIIVAAFLGSMAVAQSSISVEIDRDEIKRGETITMRIRVNDRQGAVPMDISAFGNNFEVISTRSSSRLQTVNNRVQAWTEYTLVLFPRRLGEQEIPSIMIDEQPTDPFPINVLAAEDASGASSHPDLRMETSINTTELYVQEQLLFTIRLYYTISGIRNPNFTELDLDNAVVQMLGPPSQYEQLIDGVRYGVYEMNYVIFPQRSGDLVIPDIVFQGQVTDGSSRFVFRNTHVEPVTAFAAGTEVRVRERPSDYPSYDTWLPSRSVTINESLSDNIDRIAPGDTIEREVTLQAFGLDGPALPPLPALEPENANVYAERPVIRRSVVDGNVVGERRESWSIVATDTGTITLPEVRIPWWNTENETLQYAILPARTLTVSGPRLREPTAPDNGLAVNEAVSDFPGAMLPDDSLVSTPQTPAWVMAALAALLATLATLLVMSNRRRSRPVAEHDTAPSVTEAYQRSIAANQESLAFNDLKQACQRSELPRLRQTLIAWGRQYYQDETLHTLDGLVRRCKDSRIAAASTALQAALYSSTSADTHAGTQAMKEQHQHIAKDVLGAVSQLRENEQQQRQLRQKQAPYALPPLYRS